MSPFFAPFSIVLKVVLWRLAKNSRWRWAIVAILFFWPNFHILYASFPMGKLNQPYHECNLGPFEFLPQKSYLGFPKYGRWPYKEVLEYVASDGACIKSATGELPSLAMAVDMTKFNRNAMLYEVKKARLPINVCGVPLGGSSDPQFDLTAALSIAAKQDYIIFRSISPNEPEFTNKFNDKIRRRIESGELPFRLVKGFPLNDGTSALLYRRDCTYSISPTNNTLGPGAGSGSVNVSAGPNCFWTTLTNPGSWNWIGVSSGGSGTGNGRVNYFLLSNITGSIRTGTLTIAGQTFTITQKANP